MPGAPPSSSWGPLPHRHHHPWSRNPLRSRGRTPPRSRRLRRRFRRRLWDGGVRVRDRRGCLGGTAAPAARSLVVVDVGRVGDGRGSGGTAAPAARDFVVVDACVVRLLFEGLGLTSALDGRGRLRAVDVRLSASPPLAFLRGVSSAGFSLGVPPAISGLLTPSSLAAWGGEGSMPRRLEIV